LLLLSYKYAGLQHLLGGGFSWNFVVSATVVFV
jgi:hypothetical protein